MLNQEGNMEIKICKSCNKELPVSNFYFRKETGKYRAACKQCKSVITLKERKSINDSGIKKCKICLEEKPICEYNKAGGGKWLQPYCKPCDSNRKKNYYNKNLDKVKEKSRKKYLANRKLVPDDVKAINKKKSIEILKFNAKKYRESIPKLTKEEKKLKKAESDRKYREKMGDKLREKKRIYSRTKGLELSKKRQKIMMSDINFVTKKRLRGRIYVALKRGVKSLGTMELLGCTIDDFKNYFQSLFTEGMSWDKYMEGGIHIDHIIPCVKFDLTKEEEQKKCFHYTNLQPLWAIENLKKGAKYG